MSAQSTAQVKPNTQPSQLTIAKAPGDHPFSEIIEAYLREGGVNPDEVTEEDDKFIRWYFHMPDEMIADFRLYKDPKQEVFIWLEVGIGWTSPENEADVSTYLMKCNYDYHFPFRTALTPNGAVVAQFRCYAEGISRDHMELRVNSIYQFASEVRQDLSERFGLTPLAARLSKPNQA